MPAAPDGHDVSNGPSAQQEAGAESREEVRRKLADAAARRMQIALLPSGPLLEGPGEHPNPRPRAWALASSAEHSGALATGAHAREVEVIDLIDSD